MHATLPTCRHCGTEAIPGARWCGDCGGRLDPSARGAPETADPDTDAAADVQEHDEEALAPARHFRTLLAGGIVAAVVATTVVVLAGSAAPEQVTAFTARGGFDGAGVTSTRAPAELSSVLWRHRAAADPADATRPTQHVHAARIGDTILVSLLTPEAPAMVALDAGTLELRWTAPLHMPGAARLDGDTIPVFTATQRLEIDPPTGRIVQRTDLPQASRYPRVDQVPAALGEHDLLTTSRLQALGRSDFGLLWQQFHRGAPSSVRVIENSIVAHSSGRVSSFDSQTGLLTAELQVPDVGAPGSRSVMAGRIAATTSAALTMAFDLANNSVRWVDRGSVILLGGGGDRFLAADVAGPTPAARLVEIDAETGEHLRRLDSPVAEVSDLIATSAERLGDGWLLHSDTAAVLIGDRGEVRRRWDQGFVSIALLDGTALIQELDGVLSLVDGGGTTLAEVGDADLLGTMRRVSRGSADALVLSGPVIRGGGPAGDPAATFSTSLQSGELLAQGAAEPSVIATGDGFVELGNGARATNALGEERWRSAGGWSQHAIVDGDRLLVVDQSGVRLVALGSGAELATRNRPLRAIQSVVAGPWGVATLRREAFAGSMVLEVMQLPCPTGDGSSELTDGPPATDCVAEPPDSPPEVVWRQEVSASPLARLVATDESVLIVSSQRVAVHDAATGDLERDLELPWLSRTAPTVVDGTLVRSDGGRRLAAISLDDGSVRWEHDLDAPVVSPTIGAGNQVFLVLANGSLVGIDVATGDHAQRGSIWDADDPGDGPLDSASLLVAHGVAIVRADGRTVALGAPDALIAIDDPSWPDIDGDGSSVVIGG